MKDILRKIFLIIVPILLIIGIIVYMFFFNKKYTVTFDSNGGSSVLSQKVRVNTTAKVPKEPTLENYVFENWYNDNEIYDFTTKINKDIKLVAHWTERQPVKLHTIASGKNTYYDDLVEAIALAVSGDEIYVDYYDKAIHSYEEIVTIPKGVKIIVNNGYINFGGFILLGELSIDSNKEGNIVELTIEDEGYFDKEAIINLGTKETDKFINNGVLDIEKTLEINEEKIINNGTIKKVDQRVFENNNDEETE